MKYMENQENESCIFDLLNLGTKLKQQKANDFCNISITILIISTKYYVMYKYYQRTLSL